MWDRNQESGERAARAARVSEGWLYRVSGRTIPQPGERGGKIEEPRSAFAQLGQGFQFEGLIRINRLLVDSQDDAIDHSVMMTHGHPVDDSGRSLLARFSAMCLLLFYFRRY